MRPFIVALIVIATLPGVRTIQQTPVRDQPRVDVAGTAVLSGRVVADDEKRGPLVRAIVTLSRQGIEDMRVVATDEQGEFRFTDVPAGIFSVAVWKGGYIAMSAGAPKPGMPGRLVTLKDRDVTTVPPIALIRGGVIAGRILEPGGWPVRSAQVQAVQYVTVDGQRRPRRSAGTSGTATTNDHGDYRIFGLLPGDYLVFATLRSGSVEFETQITEAELNSARQAMASTMSASGTAAPPPARATRLAPTLYPGTATESASVHVSLAKGEERAGLDFALQRVPVARISGVLTGLDGAPVAGLAIERRLRTVPDLLPLTADSARTAADGSFVLTGVPPGEYLLAARGPVGGGRGAGATPATPPLWGLTEVTVSGTDLTGVAIKLQPGMTVSGQVAASGASGTPDLTRLRVQLMPGAPNEPVPRGLSAGVQSDGRFRIEGVVPGRYKITTSSEPLLGAALPYALRSAMLSDRDVVDVAFEVRPNADVSGIAITMSDARTEVSGRLTNAAGGPVSQVYVFVFSQDRDHWQTGSRRIASVRAGENGAYSISGLPPGDYYLCALTELDTTLQYDSSYLDEVAKASIVIRLADGEKRVQHLRVGG